MKKRKNTQLALYPHPQLQDEIHVSIPLHQSSLILMENQKTHKEKEKEKENKKTKKKRINPTHLSNHHNGTSRPHPDRDSLKATSGLNLSLQVRMYYLVLFYLRPSFLLSLPLKTSTLSPLQYPCSCHHNSSLG